MKTKKIQSILKTGVCLISVMMVGFGCTYQRHHKFKSVGLPEEIYLSTPIQKQYAPDIVIFAFQSPPYAGSAGEMASRLLCTEILKSGINADITFHNTTAFADPDQLARFAVENRYDYVITGDILYFLSGDRAINSRVEEEIKIYGVYGRKLEMVGYAKAVETAPPLPATDFVVLEGSGAAAPSAELLLGRNGGKFAQLLKGMFAGNSANR